MDGAFRYWAFLSYSHDDRRMAERLHRALESYRVPRRLVGRQAPQGATVPARLHPVFRDRDELTASGHIGEVVEAALADSRALVVLCSRAAARSIWVDAEIEAFRRLRPEAPVLCVLLDGEPLASREPATAANECLPSALRTRFAGGAGVADTAPVAVDLRPQGDGWRLGLQKLVAGLAGVPLDQLVQRDARRRHVRLAWLSATLAAIAIALGTSSIFAIRARDEARVQRAEAEGLIEFMLGDLRRKLDPVGRLDILDSVGTRALRYYDGQDPRNLDGDSLGRRARSLQLIGDVDVKRGDMGKALQAFQRARESTAEILARDPDDPQRIFEHAQSVFWVGYYAWQLGDLGAAEKELLEYQRLAKRLVAIDPANLKWLAEVGYAHHNLGALLMRQRRNREALVQFELSRRVNERLVAADPADMTSLLDGLAQDYSGMSTARAQALQFDDSARLRRQEIALYDGLLKHDPRNAVALERRMFAQQFLADLLVARGDLAAAAIATGEAGRIAEAQLRLDPENTDWHQSLTKTRILQAQLLGWQGRPEEGLAVLAQAHASLDGLRKRDPEIWMWRVLLQESLAQAEASLLWRLSRRDQATRVAEASLRRLQEDIRKPQNREETLPWLAQAAGLLAMYRDAAGDHAAAHALWKTVSGALSGHEQLLDAQALAWLARARTALNDAADAERINTRLRVAGYRHPDFQDEFTRGLTAKAGDGS